MPYNFPHPVRAVVFDVYGTLLEIGPAPADALSRWHACWRNAFGDLPVPDLDEISARCRELVKQSHAASACQGIEFPEVDWPAILSGAIPELNRLSADARDEWVFVHQQCQRSLRGEAEAVPWINDLHRRGILLGIASNAQAYTRRELNVALPDLRMDLFHPQLSLWSYECGFSKPNPLIFDRLTARMLELGVKAGEILMVGDRIDNDVLPAIRAGWQAWHLWPVEGRNAGPWSSLVRSVPLLGAN